MPKTERHLAFPSVNGGAEYLHTLVECGLLPVQIAAGITVPILDESGKPRMDNDGKPVVASKYTGMIRCGISMQAGASTGEQTEVSNRRRRSSRSGSAIRLSP